MEPGPLNLLWQQRDELVQLVNPELDVVEAS